MEINLYEMGSNMKKFILIIIIMAIIVVLGIVYYNENIKTNTITDGTFVWKGITRCG